MEEILLLVALTETIIYGYSLYKLGKEKQRSKGKEEGFGL
jgi:hypothetical protein